VAEGHLFDEFRSRNLFRGNLPIKDHDYGMPNAGVLEQDLKKCIEESPNRTNPKVKPKHTNNFSINTHKKSEFSPTYGAHFTAKNSVVDPLTREEYDKYKKD
jgi:hypothetical protein